MEKEREIGDTGVERVWEGRGREVQVGVER